MAQVLAQAEPEPERVAQGQGQGWALVMKSTLAAVVAAVASHLDESPHSQYMRLCTPSIATTIGARSAPVLRPRVF